MKNAAGVHIRKARGILKATAVRGPLAEERRAHKKAEKELEDRRGARV